MKFLQIVSNYPTYLNDVNQRLINIGLTWENAQNVYRRDCFLMPHFLCNGFREIGHEADSIVFNNPLTQKIWASEFFDRDTEDPVSILVEQVTRFDPDILYIMDPITLDSSFINRLPRRPRVIIGWRAAPIPQHVNFAAFDFVFSSLPSLFDQMRSQGARIPVYFLPGVDFFSLANIPSGPKSHDISFSGQYSPYHTSRNDFLLKLSIQQLQQRDGFDLDFFLAAGDPLSLPAGIYSLARPPLWGREMLEMYASSRASFHVPIDIAEGNSTAMRMFEVCGVGTPIFVHDSADLEGLFEEAEVLRFGDAKGLVETFIGLRREPGALDEIGALARKRCLTDHSSVVRARQLLHVCERV